MRTLSALIVYWTAVCLTTAGCGPSGCWAPELSIPAREYQVAEGLFSQLHLAFRGVSEQPEAFVLALRDADQNGGRLTVIPMDGGPSCEIGPAHHYVAFSKDAGGEDIDTRIFVIEWPEDSELASIRFADLDCEPRPPALEGISYPAWPYFLWDPESGDVTVFVVLTGSGELHVLDPWEEASALVAAQVSRLDLQWRQMRLWLIDGGQLVVLDHRGVPLARMGTAVSGLSLHQDPPEAAFVDGSALYVLQEPGGQPLLVEDDACEPHYLQPDVPWEVSSRMIAYLAPCAERRLVVLDRETDERRVYAGQVGRARRIGDWLFYVTGPPGTATVGDLWAVPPGEDAVWIGGDGDLDRIGAAGTERFLVLLDSDGDRGRLGLWQAGMGFTAIADDVAELFQLLPQEEPGKARAYAVLGEFDGELGTAFVLDPEDLGLEAIAPGVTRDGFRDAFRFGFGSRNAFLGEYDGDTGTLFLVDRIALTVQRIASGVPEGQYKFSMIAEAIGYLDEYDPLDGVGRLQVLVIPTGDRITVDEDVTEFHEEGWLEWGILYSIGRGEYAGVYLSTVELE